MAQFHRFVRRKNNLIFMLVLLIVLSIIVMIKKNTYVSSKGTLVPPSNLSEHEKFCWYVSYQMLSSRPSHNSEPLTSDNETIPYSYNDWKSTVMMPRAFTPCEHAIAIHLLSILKKEVFEKHNIAYMMMAGTLIGSYFGKRFSFVSWNLVFFCR